MPKATAMAVLAAFACFRADADVFHLANGDRLTGTKTRSEAGFVAIDVPRIGIVTIPEELVARVDAEDGKPPDEAAPATEPRAPGLIDAWDIIADLATTTATGNTETLDVNFVAGATRVGERFDHVLGASWQRGETEALLAKDQLDLNYDLRWKTSESWYAVANFEFFRDAIKDIDKRYTAGVGLGHTFWQSARGRLSTDGGVSQVFEQRADTATSDNPALRWSLSYQHWLAPERIELFHNNQLLRILASDRGWVWDSDTGVRLHVNSRWQAGLRLDLQHETAPAAGRGKTDAAYAVSLGVKL